MAFDIAKTIVTVLLGGSGTLALLCAAYQLSIRRRAHLLELYRQAFATMDNERVRDTRHFVYKVDREAYKTEHWLQIESQRASPNHAAWSENRSKAEMVAYSGAR